MTKHIDGGPAFPYGQPNVTVVFSEGMSLRDYFAAAAFTNYALHYQGRMDADEIASECYSLADAMLAERAKRKEAQP